MPRRTPPDRLEKLVAVAASVFVEHGFARTQMDDVAAVLGVSKGTLYRSVESKEALLAAVLTYGDVPHLLPDSGPITPLSITELSAVLRDELAHGVGELKLSAAASSSPLPQAREELGAEIELLTLDLFEAMAHQKVKIMVLDRCAPELPELAGQWFHGGRYVVVDLWSAYLRRRVPALGSRIDIDTTARTIVEVVSLWAVKMPWDPAPRPYGPEIGAVCSVMIRRLVTGASE